MTDAPEIGPEQARKGRAWQHDVPAVPRRVKQPAPEPTEPLPPPRVRGSRRPAGRRKYTTDNPRKDVVLRRTLDQMTDLTACLEHHASDPRARKLLELMADPKQGRKSLALLVQQADFTRREIVEAYQQYKADEMRIRLSNALPTLADDLAEDARSRDEVCTTCNGSGEIVDPTQDDAAPQTCRACSGRGSHRVIGHVESRKMLLEVTGLVKKGGGFGVNISMGAGASVDSFDSLISKAHDITNAPIATTAEEVTPDE